VLWDLPKAKAEYSLQLASESLPALSPGGKYLAAATTAGIELYESTSGELLGRLSGEVGLWPTVGFSPDGRRLAAAETNRFRTWDLESGELSTDILIPVVGQEMRILWLGDDYVAVQGHALLVVDLNRKIVLWEYLLSPAETASTAQWQGHFWRIGKDAARRNDVLFPTSLPDQQALGVAKRLEANQVLVVQPGAAVSLEMNVQTDAETIERIRNSLVERLSNNGLEVRDGQSLKLIAATRTGETHSVSYHMTGAERATVSVTDRVSSLEFQSAGQTAWKAEQVAGAPYFVRLAPGQSLQQYVSENTKPNLEFFSTARIPTHVARPLPEGQRAYGRSMLQDDGTILPMPAK
jgi:hypothetical protein